MGLNVGILRTSIKNNLFHGTISFHQYEFYFFNSFIKRMDNKPCLS